MNENVVLSIPQEDVEEVTRLLADAISKFATSNDVWILLNKFISENSDIDILKETEAKLGII